MFPHLLFQLHGLFHKQQQGKLLFFNYQVLCKQLWHYLFYLLWDSSSLYASCHAQPCVPDLQYFEEWKDSKRSQCKSYQETTNVQKLSFYFTETIWGSQFLLSYWVHCYNWQFLFRSRMVMVFHYSWLVSGNKYFMISKLCLEHSGGMLKQN